MTFKLLYVTNRGKTRAPALEALTAWHAFKLGIHNLEIKSAGVVTWPEHKISQEEPRINKYILGLISNITGNYQDLNEYKSKDLVTIMSDDQSNNYNLILVPDNLVLERTRKRLNKLGLLERYSEKLELITSYGNYNSLHEIPGPENDFWHSRNRAERYARMIQYINSATGAVAAKLKETGL